MTNREAGMVTFSDIFKKSFLEGYANIELSAKQIVVVMFFALLLGVYIYGVYRFLTKKTFYSKSFNISLVLMSVITASIILTVQSSVVISLGMVGALSIVRFRTAIKEPMEIVFLFWSLATGIVIGAGMIPLAVIGSVIIGIILILFANRKFHDTPYILIVNCDDEKAEESALGVIEKSVDKFLVKAKTVNAGGVELTAEVRVKDAATSFVNRINELNGVSGATLVSYNGEYMS